MTGMHLSFYPNIWSTRFFKYTSNGKDAHWIKLHQVEEYWETRVKLVFALKEDVGSSLLAASMVKIELAKGVFVVDVERHFPSEPKENVHTYTSASMSSPIFPLFRSA